MISEQRAGCVAIARDEKVEVILHSHLRRASDTAAGLFAGVPSAGVPLECDRKLFEKSLSEHAGFRSLPARVGNFRARLLHRSESVLVIVGHSAFFRMLVPELSARKEDLGNLSVWRASLEPSGAFGPLDLVIPGWHDGVRKLASLDRSAEV